MSAPQHQGRSAALPMHMVRPHTIIARVAPPTRDDRTRSPSKLSSTPDDRQPQPIRPGADAGLGMPSRYGNRLHYRNGLVTDLAGAVLQPVAALAQYRPTHDGRERARPVSVP